MSVPTISSVFREVQDGASQYGVVPIENSSNGSVVFTLDLFVDKAKVHPDVVVIGDAFVSVRHCLLGRKAKNSKDGGKVPCQLTVFTNLSNQSDIRCIARHDTSHTSSSLDSVYSISRRKPQPRQAIRCIEYV